MVWLKIINVISTALVCLQIERTALHYAMSVDKVEAMSTILIGCGAKRIAKDLVNIIRYDKFYNNRINWIYFVFYINHLPYEIILVIFYH